ncbi:MAG: apolipoprotein N-acyltransferase, partial [Desulfobacterota bacterium]|nr:apolipoprotein N-acyltransferase [Thermodesulfobacteriota bacterium]
AVPCYFFPGKEPEPFLRHLCDEIKVSLLFGSITYESQKGQKSKDYRYFNSAFLLSPHTKKITRYDKVHLVPFGEYVPCKTIFPFVEKLVVGVGDFSPGRKFPLFSVSGAKFGVLICYEIIFPQLSRRYCDSGGNFLVTITNDAWFGFSSAPYQHFSMAVFRAVENRTGVVRVANSGISGIIEPTGYIQSQTPLFVSAFLNGKVPITFDCPFYTCYGEVGVGFCGIGLLIFIVLNQIRGKKIVNYI